MHTDLLKLLLWAWIGISMLGIHVSQATSNAHVLDAILATRDRSQENFSPTNQQSGLENSSSITNIDLQLKQARSVSLSFQNVSVRRILQVLAKISGLNIVVMDSVQGEMSLNLNQVSWQEVLEFIIKMQGLATLKSGSILAVAPLEDITSLEQQLLKTHQQYQELKPLASELFQLRYANVRDIGLLVNENKTSLLSSQGFISIDERTNTMYVRDTNSFIESLREFIEKIDIPNKQVFIQARIVRVTKDLAREIGIRWGMDRVNLHLLEASNPALTGLALARVASDVLLDLELSALESENKAKIISSPRLITSNQQTALIESGTEIPYQQSTASGATAVSFKKAALSLQVTPNITADKKIILDIIVNQDSPDFAREVLGTPPINTQAIKSNVLLNDGETIVIGGIFQQSEANSYRRIPILGAMPGVGFLFRIKVMSQNHEELLIFITPTLLDDTDM